MEQHEVAAMVNAWIKANRVAQQQTDWSCYAIAKFLGYGRGTIEWDAAVQGSAQFRFNGLAY